MDLNTLVDKYCSAIRSRDAAAVAMIARIKGRDAQGQAFNMANALHFHYNPQGLIQGMINWHGQAA